MEKYLDNKIFKNFVVNGLVFYLAGVIVVNIYLQKYGFTEFEPFSMKYVLTGLIILLVTSSIFLMVRSIKNDKEPTNIPSRYTLAHKFILLASSSSTLTIVICLLVGLNPYEMITNPFLINNVIERFNLTYFFPHGTAYFLLISIFVILATYVPIKVNRNTWYIKVLKSVKFAIIYIFLGYLAISAFYITLYTSTRTFNAYGTNSSTMILSWILTCSVGLSAFFLYLKNEKQQISNIFNDSSFGIMYQMAVLVPIFLLFFTTAIYPEIPQGLGGGRPETITIFSDNNSLQEIIKKELFLINESQESILIVDKSNFNNVLKINKNDIQIIETTINNKLKL